MEGHRHQGSSGFYDEDDDHDYDNPDDDDHDDYVPCLTRTDFPKWRGSVIKAPQVFMAFLSR